MPDLSPNLSRSEFACKCGRPECNRTPVDVLLVRYLQETVHFFEKHPPIEGSFKRIAININSGHRCIAYDLELKNLKPEDFNGIKLSEHVWGGAADFWMEVVLESGRRIKIPDDMIADFLELRFEGRFGIGRYDGRTHFDVRPYCARWDNRGK